MIPSPVNLSTVPSYLLTTAAEQSKTPAMISRRRSAPTAAAMSIERTTSANNTVTCLYSADGAGRVSRVPHSAQNLAVGPDCAPQDPQNNPIAVSPPPPSWLGSTSVSFHPLLSNVRHIA